VPIAKLILAAENLLAELKAHQLEFSNTGKCNYYGYGEKARFSESQIEKLLIQMGITSSRIPLCPRVDTEDGEPDCIVGPWIDPTAMRTGMYSY
jgi:hypothetical protein